MYVKMKTKIGAVMRGTYTHTRVWMNWSTKGLETVIKESMVQMRLLKNLCEFIFPLAAELS